MRNDYTRLLDIWGDWFVVDDTQDPAATSMFAAIKAAYGQDAPAWLGDNKAVHEFNNAHYLDGATRIASSLFATIVGEEPTAAKIQAIARVIVNRFGKRWEKVAAAYALEYEPIENYDRTEERTVHNSEKTTPGVTDTEETKQGVDITVTDTPGVKDKQTQKSAMDYKTTTDNYDKKFGYNSSSAVPSGENCGETRTTGEADDNITEIVTEHEGDNERHTEADADNNVTTRKTSHEGDDFRDTWNKEDVRIHGNIGVTTSQQMLESEVNLWRNYDFVKLVIDDVNSVITIPIY